MDLLNSRAYAIHADKLDDPADVWRAFTERTSAATFRQDFTVSGQVRTVQAAGDAVVCGSTVAVTELVTAETWPRVRTRRWHSYEICGNRTNVAAYRARTTNPDQSS